MSFEGVRKALDELGAVVNRDKVAAQMRFIAQQNQRLTQENNGLHAYVEELQAEKAKLKVKAQSKDTEIHKEAYLLFNDMRRRWQTEEKPMELASAVREEIMGYPSKCTESTRKVLDARVESCLYEKMREGWYSIFFAISNAVKVPSPAPIQKPLPKAKIISISKENNEDQKSKII